MQFSMQGSGQTFAHPKDLNRNKVRRRKPCRRHRFSVFQATSKEKIFLCRGAQLTVRPYSVLHPNENAISKWLNTVLAKEIIYL